MQTTHQNIQKLKLSSELTHAWQEIVGPLSTSRLGTEQVQALASHCDISITELARQLLPVAAHYAVTPISHFSVGAVAIDEQHRFFMGANYERTQLTLGSTIHAEQATLFNAISHGAEKLTHLVVSAAPCGHCRQFIRELTESAGLTVCINDDSYEFQALLPFSFGPDDLNVNEHITRPQNAQTCSVDELASFSYSPYSDAKIGLIGKQQGKRCAQSWYIENAAFNPSASPVSLLFSQLQLNGIPLIMLDEIEVAMNCAPVSFNHELNALATLHPELKLSIHS